MNAHAAREGRTAIDVREFEAALLERRRRLLDDVQSLEEVKESGDLSTLATHLADLGSDQEAADLSLGRRESASGEIHEIDQALERIADGSYGLCEECKKRISRTRLEAIPYANLCLACKEIEER
jgi:DnaK suppressor protein